MKQRSREAGFSMIEVLVALLIVSLALAALYQAMTQSFRSIRAARDQEQILTQAMSTLELVRRADRIQTQGRNSNGVVWRVWRQPIGIQKPSGDVAGPSWLVFEAKTASGQPIIILKTATPQ